MLFRSSVFTVFISIFTLGPRSSTVDASGLPEDDPSHTVGALFIRTTYTDRRESIASTSHAVPRTGPCVCRNYVFAPRFSVTYQCLQERLPMMYKMAICLELRNITISDSSSSCGRLSALLMSRLAKSTIYPPDDPTLSRALQRLMMLRVHGRR